MLVIAALIAATSASSAADHLSLGSQAQLRRHRIEQRRSQASPLRTPKALKEASTLTATPAALAFVTFAEGFTPADLEAEGVRVLTSRGGVSIAEVAWDDIERIAALPMVRSLELQRDLKTDMNLARESAGVDLIHSAGPTSGLEQPFTGRGVVTAIVDQGVDPNHINFLDADGKNRIGYLSHLRYNAAMTGMAESFYGADVLDADPVSNFNTDDVTTYHGTHTLGILAGSYSGEVRNAAINSTGSAVTVSNVANPYTGVAPESKIAVSCGTLADAFVAYGMDYIYSYSRYLGLPLVYSLSLGSSTGPHDPNSSMARFLNQVGEEAIICVSAGNEGDRKVALNKTLSPSDLTIKSFVHPYAYQYNPEGDPTDFTNNNIRYGNIAIYSDTDTPFELQAVIYNVDRGYRVVKRMPVIGTGTATYYCSSDDYKEGDTDVVGDAQFVKAFEGYVGVGAQIDAETGRFYGMVDYYTLDTPENRKSGTYILGFEITGTDGQRIDCYCDGNTTWIDSYGVAGFDDGSADGSISDMAVAPNLIVVGAYNTRQTYATLDGGMATYPGEDFTPGRVSGFSSFGTLADGRKLPTVCGPGTTIVSSISNPHLDYMTQQASPAQARAYKEYLCTASATGPDGKEYWWTQQMGTSMSTPFVAGSIALWLQADPSLTVNDVKEIIALTSTRDEDVAAGDPVRWGAGKFNAIAGLKEVIRRKAEGIEGITADSGDSDGLIVTTTPGELTVFLAEAPRLEVNLYNTAGTCALSAAAAADELTLSTATLPAGVYILRVNGAISRKIAVR